MRVSLLNIILLSIIILLPCESSQASSPVDNDNSSVHGQLSCLDCHSDISKNSFHPYIEDINSSLSAFLIREQCVECHGQVFENPGSAEQGNLKKIEIATSDLCISCHNRHHEKVAHDTHMNVPCLSCHIKNVKPLRIMEDNRHIWGYDVGIIGEYDPHLVTSERDDICSRCHFESNNLGVSDHVLPAKSIVCIPCHAATLSAGDIPSIGAIIILLTGVSSILLTWMCAGRREGKRNRISFAGLLNILKEMVLDGFLQRRLLKVSLRRWAIHALIFFPFMFRFLYGVIALILSIYKPECDLTWAMLDKNNPVTGFLYDLSGILILAGGCLMILEKRSNETLSGIQALPKNNIFIHTLLGGIIITGFALEGARISMTGSPEGSEFAFIGYGISRLLTGFDLTGIYIYLWYIHAIVTGAFIACLPFSRMFHIFVAPLSVFLKGVSGKKNEHV